MAGTTLAQLEARVKELATQLEGRLDELVAQVERSKPTSWTAIFGAVTPMMLWAVIGIFGLVLLVAVGNSMRPGHCFVLWGFQTGSCVGIIPPRV